jgi:hypothetical protein
LRRDRRDERFERIRCKRRTQSTQLRHDAREDRLCRGEGVERIEVELRAEQLPHGRADLSVERIDVDASVRRRDPNLTTSDRTPECIVLPQVRRITSPAPKPRRGQIEVVRLWEAKEGQLESII